MHYAKALIPITLLTAATVAGVACTATSGNEDTEKSRAAQSQGPPGNNGTVKIQEIGDEEEIPDNDPHVSCGFQIEFRGFDEGNLKATWLLEGHPPSGKGEQLGAGEVAIGEDGAGGANDLDAKVLIDISQLDLSGQEEHPQQGFHVKLTVHAEGSQGADTKHKVFWVTSCEAPPPPPEDAGVDAPPPPPPEDAGPPPPPQDGGKAW